MIGGPGSGKSTLCTALARHYVAAGQEVDHFQEEEVLTRPDFSQVAAEFANGAGSAAPKTLVDAFGQYVHRRVADGTDLVITDALIPFIPSLLVWGHTEVEIEEILTELEEVSANVSVLVVLLAGDPALTLQRAIDREDDGWVDSYLEKLSRWPGTSHVISLPGAIDQLRRETDVSRRLVHQSGWELLEIDAAASTERQTEIVKRRLQGILRE